MNQSKDIYRNMNIWPFLEFFLAKIISKHWIVVWEIDSWSFMMEGEGIYLSIIVGWLII
jgi:hypothetical protein